MTFNLFIVLLLLYIVRSTESTNSNVSLEISPKTAVANFAEGDGSLLTCTGVGHNPAFFNNLKWFDPKGNEINSANEFYRDNYIIKNRQGSVQLLFVKPKDHLSGKYQCRGTFQNAIDVNQTITVNFYEDINWQDCPTSQALIRGSKSPLIRCKVYAKPPAELSWSKNGGPLPSNLHSSNDGLIVDGLVSDSVAGKYDVEAHVSETGRIKYTSIVVNVYTLPEIVESKSKYEIVEEEEATLECKGVGQPEPHYYWFDSMRRNLSSVGGYSVDTNNGKLIIHKVRPEDSGEFKCIIENPAGSVEHITNVNVLTRPKISQFLNVSAVEGQNTKLVCNAIGNPVPEIQIRKDGEMSAITSGGNYFIAEQNDKQQASLTLRITKTTLADDGLYYCLASNKVGKQEQIGHLQIEHKPDLSKTPKIVKTWKDRQVNITCIVNAIPNATVSWYFQDKEILPYDRNYRIHNEDELSNFKNGFTGLHYLVVNPVAYTSRIYGRYKCRAENKHGYNEAFIELSEAHRPVLNGEPDLLGDSSTSIKIRIPAHLLNDGGLPIKKILVRYRERNETEQMARVEEFPFDNEFILKGLLPRRTYYVSISARNDVGNSDWSVEREKPMPKETVPDCPKFTYPRQISSMSNNQNCDAGQRPIDSDYPDRFDVKWLQPYDNGRPIEFYTLTFYPVRRSYESWYRVGDQKELFSSSNEQLVQHLTNLRANTTYHVELRAKNEEGYSSVSRLLFRTSLSNDIGPSTFHEQVTKAFTDFQLMIVIMLITIVVILIVLDIILYIRYDFGFLFCICHGCSSSDRHRAVKKIKNSHSLNTNYSYQRTPVETDRIMDTSQKAEFKAELENRLIRMPKNSAV